jgi:hypothetical protein
VYEAHPDRPNCTRWTGYIETRILRSRWFPWMTDMVISKATEHFARQTQESLGHDGSALGYCAREIFKRVCTPYVDAAEDERQPARADGDAPPAALAAQ